MQAVLVLVFAALFLPEFSTGSMYRALATALALTWLLVAPLASEAVPVEAASVVTPSIGHPPIPFLGIPAIDLASTFTIANLSGAGVNISQIVIEAAAGLVFNGTSSLMPNLPFTVLGGTGALTGFTGQTVAANSVILNFTGFDPLEVFSFAIDVDTGTNRTVSSFTGSTLRVTFGGSVPSTTYYDSYQGLLASVSGDVAASVPEPASLLLLGSALLGIGLACRRQLIRLIRN